MAKQILKALLLELLVNGKMFLGWLIQQFLTPYPGLVTALHDFLAVQNTATATALLAQIALVVGGLHRVPKLVRAVLDRLNK